MQGRAARRLALLPALRSQGDLIDHRAGCSARTAGPVLHPIRAETHPRNQKEGTRMPEKKTKQDKRYTIDGRTFTWTAEDGSKVTIPMRVKLKVLRSLSGRALDAEAMFAMLEQIIPDQADVLDEMDIVTDFQPMFEAWQSEYNALTGATPGE